MARTGWVYGMMVMLVVDSSVLIAILLAEPDAEHYAKQLALANPVYISAVSILESSIVIQSKEGEQGVSMLDELLCAISPSIIAFDSDQVRLARKAWQQYGKGRHPARLNFGDCCSYAVAKSLGLPLLFQGNDFSQTDLLLA